MATKKRLKLTRRASPDQLPNMRMTKRDWQILEMVYAYDGLTTPQIAAALFPGDPEQTQEHAQQSTVVKEPGSGRLNQCRQRLRLMYHHGLLYRHEQPSRLTEGRLPFLYLVDEKGAQLLCQAWDCEIGDLDWQPPEKRKLSPVVIPHHIAVNDVRLSISLAAQYHPAFSLPEWISEKTLKREQAERKEYVAVEGPRGGRRKVAVIADGYFHLETPEYHLHHFIEVDRRSESLQRWADKTRAYIAYYDSGLYEKRFNTKGLRILTVTTGPARLRNLKKMTEQVGGGHRFWFTTFADLSPDTALTQSIWHKATVEGTFALAV